MCYVYQAEDGVRGGHVTVVQTCALPILVEELQQSSWQSLWISTHLALCRCYRDVGDYAHAIDLGERAMRASKHLPAEETEIGRASCRERVRQAVAGGAVPRKPAHTSRLR